MSWESSTQMCYVVDGATKIGQSALGDIEKALGRTCKSQIQLISDIDSGGNRVNKINKWARFKPIVRPSVDYSNQLKAVTGGHAWKTPSELASESKVPWWIGSDGQCGLAFTHYGSLGTQTIASTGFFHDLLQSGGVPWSYTPPTASQNLRTYDFHKYFAGAAKPVEGVEDSYQLTQNGTLTIRLTTNRGYSDKFGNDVALSLSDFTINGIAVNDFYVGLLIYRSSSIWAYKTAAAKVGAGDTTIEFTNMSGNYGGQTVTIVPFLSSNKITGTDPGGGTYVSLDVAPKSVQIRAYTQPYTLTALAQWKNTMYVQVLYDVRLFNNTNTAVSNDTIYLKVFRSGVTEPVGSTTRSGISVAANSFTDVTNWNLGIPVNDTHSTSASYTLQVTSASGHWSTTTPVEAPRN